MTAKPIPYLNRRQSENLAFLTMSLQRAEALIQEPVFGPEHADLKRGRTYLRKAYDQIMSRCQEEDRKKYSNTHKNFYLKVVPNSTASPNEMIIRTEYVAQLAEAAIGQQCVGCEKHDWKQCPLRPVLMNVGVPAANDDLKDCQYKQ